MSEHGSGQHARARLLTSAAAVMLICAPGAAAYEVRVEGLKGEPLSNAQAMLIPVRESTQGMLRQTFRAQVDHALSRALQALGYYQYQIHYRWEVPEGAKEKGTEKGTSPSGAAHSTSEAAPESDSESDSDDSSESASGGMPPDPEREAAEAGVPFIELSLPKQDAQDPEQGLFSREFGRQSLIASDLESQKAAGDSPEQRSVLVAKVDLGEPVRIESAHFEVTGDDLTARSSVFRRLTRSLPKKGDQLNHGLYTDFKSSVERTAMRYGYFDGKFVENELQVNAVTNEGGWLLVYDPGVRYGFGPVSFQGSQIREEILQNLVPFEEGKPYSSDDIAELNRRLSATGWFNSIVVTPDILEGRKSEDKKLPVEARVSPKTGNSLEAGLGYSTDVGPRGKLIWKKPWLNDSGHSLQSETDISSLEQLLDVTYKMPLEENALEHFWLFRGGYKHEDLNDTQSDAMSLEVSRRWEPYEGWQKGVALKWRYDDFTQGSVESQSMMLYPEFSLSRTRSRGGLMPRWGDSQRYTIGYANKMWGSDVDALMLEAQFVLIRTYARNHRFVLRSHLGWIETGDFRDVPPDLRFFAGGDRSVRGYDYESISPEDENGELTGASKMLTASVEYQLRVAGKWWGAVFLDVGRADNDFEFSNFKKGAGVGVRWESPLGPVKLDIARPVGDPGENGIQFYIGLGPEL